MPARPAHPGEILKWDVLPDLGMDVGVAAHELDVKVNELSELLDGKRPVDAEWALRLGQFCGNGPTLWMNMQAAVDLWDAENRLGERLKKIPPHYAE
jgi:addiction module HigA family antidote